ncbi:MAG: hypothetical protein A2Z75_08515 [Chloroflexi bacterium RBG_13_50_10]|nr:MAG: hypothetical protein A2Z75_08515 [Chloroflexi bacterium RBG_13_50_10]
MCDWQAVGAIGTIAGAAIVAISLFFAGYQIREDKRNRAAAVLKDLFDELASDPNRNTLNKVYHLKNVKNIGQKLDQKIEMVVNRLELLGIMVEGRIIEEKMALKLVRGQPLRFWYKLESYINKKRGPKGRGHYARFLEDYVIRSTKYQMAKVPEEEWTRLDGVNLVKHFKKRIEKGKWRKWKHPK